MRKGMWFGIFFLLLGISILLKVFFKIDLPVFKSLFAFFLIFIGFKMLFGTFWCSKSMGDGENVSTFRERHFKFESGDNDSDLEKEYSTVFGSSTIDLTDLAPEKLNGRHVDINTAFGETVVTLKRSTPVKIRVNAGFAEARTPDDNMVAFGTLNYSSPNASSSEGEPARIYIRGNVAFGSLVFKLVD